MIYVYINLKAFNKYRILMNFNVNFLKNFELELSKGYYVNLI